MKSTLLRLMTWLRTRENQTLFNALESWSGGLYQREIQGPIDAFRQNIVEDKKRRGVPESMEEYRKKFKRAPLGRWTSPYDYGPFSSDAWEFHADGTGKIFYYSGMGDQETSFEWQEESERTIKFREMDGDEPEDENEEEERQCWGTLTYDFKIIEHYGSTIVMFTVPEGEIFKFWLTRNYLEFEGDISTQDENGDS